MLFTLFWRFLLSVESRMPAEITFELKVKVLTLRSKGYSYNKIVKKLCEEGDTISMSSVIRIIARDKDKVIGYTWPPKSSGPRTSQLCVRKHSSEKSRKQSNLQISPLMNSFPVDFKHPRT